VAVGSNNSDSVDALTSYQAQAIVNLDRHRMSTDEVIADIKARLENENLEGAKVQFLLQGSVLASAFESSSPILIEIKGHDLATLRKYRTMFKRKLRRCRGSTGSKPPWLSRRQKPAWTWTGNGPPATTSPFPRSRGPR
jgi:multidrug efflux pump subunit AcrB